MRIKITSEPGVCADVRPDVGTVHEVAEVRKTPLGRRLYIIKVDRAQIGILETECEIVEG